MQVLVEKLGYVAYALTIFVCTAMLLLGWGAAFAIGTACTNQFNCTSDWCPSVCDRVAIAFWANTLGQLAVIVLAAVQMVRGRLIAWQAGASLGASLLLAVLCFLVADSWEA